MAEPAYGGADDPGPPERGSRRSDPLSPGWADVQRALITQARSCALAVAELARVPGNPAALAMAASVLSVLENLGEIGRRWAADEAVLSAERARAYAQGVADCKAAHC